MKSLHLITVIVVSTLIAGTAAMAEPAPASGTAKAPFVRDTYPGLTAGGLSYATLGELPEGVLLRADSVDITLASLDAAIAEAPEAARVGFKKNGFFLLEQIATKKLVLGLAKRKAAETKKGIAEMSEEAILDDYVQTLTSGVIATDEDAAKFYVENKDACGGATLDQIRDQVKEVVLKEKKQEAVEKHIESLGQLVPIVVSAAWVKEQAASARENPVDKARGSGRPTMVDFGADGCRPCEMMTPILADLKKKYENKANVLFVHVRENEILARRYGVQGIPLQVFFDKDGKETYRHTGFYPQAEIEKKLAAMGVQ